MQSAHKNLVILFLPNSQPHAEFRSELPYTLLYLERALRNMGVEVILLDESRNPNYGAYLVETEHRILLAGVSAMTGYQIQGGLTFSRRVREICSAPVVWGGCHPTLLPDETLREESVDYVVVGQGEGPLRELVERLRTGQEVSDIPGLCCKRDGVISVTPSSTPKAYDAFPIVDFGRIDLNDYVVPDGDQERWLPYFASHGCPFHCTFCSVGLMYQRRWYPKAISQIIQELRHLKEHAKLDGIHFYDENLLVDIDFSRQLAKALIDAKLDLKWRCGAHAHLFTHKFTNDDVKLMALAGCVRIYIGAESGDQETLDLLEKRAQVEDTYRFIEMLKPYGIVPRLSTMVCLPLNPGRDFDATRDMIRRAKLMDHRLEATIFFYTPYPGN